MDFAHVTTDAELADVCRRMLSARQIGFDTEFVSEDCYRPDLCLIQLNIDGYLAIVDPKAVTELRPFWEALATGSHETIVHAGREEFRFCLAELGHSPQRWVDVQLAAGLVGLEYPAAYHKLIGKLLGVNLAKGETRTDWRRRPLSSHQLEYALQDVVHLIELRDRLIHQLTRLNRTSWLDDENSRWQESIIATEQEERWRRVSGITAVPARSLVVLRELWRWREEAARQQNRPPKWILRDDLLVELARRGSADISRIVAVRGMERRGQKNRTEEIADVIRDAKKLPAERWPAPRRTELPQQIQALAQFLNTALASICRRQNLAPSLVGTVQDIRDLITHHLRLDEPDDPLPMLAQGWRAEVIGHTVERLLAGQLALRIVDPLSEQPIVLDPVEGFE